MPQRRDRRSFFVEERIGERSNSIGFEYSHIHRYKYIYIIYMVQFSKCMSVTWRCPKRPSPSPLAHSDDDI